MSDLQLKITMGDIDVNLQGEGELVYKIFKELREEGLGALHRKQGQSLNPDDAETSERDHRVCGPNDTTGKEPVVEKKSSKTKKRSVTKQPQLIKDLDLSGKDVGKSLKEFVLEKKPLINIERTAVFVYYLQNILNIPEITVDHVFSCYKDIGVRLPKNLPQNLNDTASSRYGYIEVNNGNYTMSILGINLIEQDLPKKE